MSRDKSCLRFCSLGLLAARLCHSGIVWVEEAYPTAAAIQILDGKALYRDVWFDKPPLSALIYLLWDARIGVISADRGRGLRIRLLLDVVAIRARSVGPARRLGGGAVARILPDVRNSGGGDGDGARSVDGAAAHRGGLLWHGAAGRS